MFDLVVLVSLMTCLLPAVFGTSVFFWFLYLRDSRALCIDYIFNSFSFI